MFFAVWFGACVSIVRLGSSHTSTSASNKQANQKHHSSEVCKNTFWFSLRTRSDCVVVACSGLVRWISVSQRSLQLSNKAPVVGVKCGYIMIHIPHETYCLKCFLLVKLLTMLTGVWFWSMGVYLSAETWTVVVTNSYTFQAIKRQSETRLIESFCMNKASESTLDSCGFFEFESIVVVMFPNSFPIYLWCTLHPGCQSHIMV